MSPDYHPHFTDVKPAPTAMPTAMPSSSYNEKAVTIAVSLLKLKSPQTIQTLKDLLTFIPNPNLVKEVLKTAVIELMHTSPQAAFWLFQHPEVLEPEIQVREIIAEALTTKIHSWGYTSDDFRFTTDQHLILSEAAKATFLSHEPVFHEPISDDEVSLTLIRFLLTQ